MLQLFETWKLLRYVASYSIDFAIFYCIIEDQLQQASYLNQHFCTLSSNHAMLYFKYDQCHQLCKYSLELKITQARGRCKRTHTHTHTYILKLLWTNCWIWSKINGVIVKFIRCINAELISIWLSSLLFSTSYDVSFLWLYVPLNLVF